MLLQYSTQLQYCTKTTHLQLFLIHSFKVYLLDTWLYKKFLLE